jgi:NAD(P)-dependent dehydrogenase (short-subunit alcohol dehydrogenase family)
MRTHSKVALVSGGASGLGLATARALMAKGSRVVILDLPGSRGKEVAEELGEQAAFVPGDVTDPAAVEAAVQQADAWGDSLRILVHTAGVGGPLRIVDREGNPGSLETFQRLISINLVGTFNVLRFAAASMAKREPEDGERGVCVLTSSVAAFDGQIGQVHYAASKSGVVGMTLPAARDLSRKLIRVCTIAPGTFDTPLLGRLPEDILAGLTAEVPHPSRLGRPEEYAALAVHIVENQMLNGEVIRLDGALRMSAR